MLSRPAIITHWPPSLLRATLNILIFFKHPLASTHCMFYNRSMESNKVSTRFSHCEVMLRNEFKTPACASVYGKPVWWIEISMCGYTMTRNCFCEHLSANSKQNIVKFPHSVWHKINEHTEVTSWIVQLLHLKSGTGFALLNKLL